MKKFLIAILVWLLAGCAAGTALPTATRPDPPAPTPLPTLTQGAWESRGLAGRLVLIPYASGNTVLEELDLASGKTSPLFSAPATGWLAGAAVAPGGKQAALAYAPPPKTGKQQYSFSDLYLLKLDGSGELRPLLTRRGPYESYFQPAWTPDGLALVYVHFFNSAAADKPPVYRYSIEKIGLEEGAAAQVLVENAIWPALSADGKKISYLTSGADGQDNALYVAEADGSRPVAAIKSAAPAPVVDAHMFSADGQTILFSMPNPLPASQSGQDDRRAWWEKLLGIGLVEAHNAPSDWYSVPASGGGTPQRISQINDMYLDGRLSPDGRSLAFIGMNGLFVLDLASHQVTRLSNTAYIGSIDWLP